MFPIEYQVNVRRGKGPVQKYALLENQADQYLVVLHPSLVKDVAALSGKSGAGDDALISLLADEAMVLDRKKGTPLPAEEAARILRASENAVLRRAGTWRTPLPAVTTTLSGEDLAYAFALEVAKRRTAA